MDSIRLVDLFAGIGGFHAALHYSRSIGATCVFASEIDERCNDVYEANYGFRPDGDIWPWAREHAATIPDHEILTAGFPCQPFSKSGHQRGIAEARGTLFEAILLVLEAKRPPFVLLENVRNLVGPRHHETWATIVRLLRGLGYAVSSEPTLMSPHLLPPGVGSPQLRDRVFIPAVYVGEADAEDVSSTLPALVSRRPYSGWDPASWRVMEYLESKDPVDATASRIKRDKTIAIDMWDDLVQALPAPPPRFPIWTDVFLGRLRLDTSHPIWKQALIQRNLVWYNENRSLIDQWIETWGVGQVFPSYRKLEWQAQDRDRSLWSHALQFRPSGIRVRPLTYLPALVAINQTSIVGPLRRTITPYEAGLLQGFAPAFLDGRDFIAHPEAGVAFHQFGNAVHVGVTRLIAEVLIRGRSEDGLVGPSAEWASVLDARTQSSGVG